jgi:Fe-S oxidoreductase
VTSLRLPLLEPHRDALEKCVYCPKLSRAACPVSNVEATETLTPWGKMSMAYFAARGDVPIDEEHAAPAWACSACMACRERCDHKNEVGAVLVDARAELFARKAAPPAAYAVAEAFAARDREASTVGGDESGVPVLVGCGYERRNPDVAEAALSSTRTLLGREVRAIRRCCGLPLLYAGDRRGFVAAANRLSDELTRSLGAASEGGPDELVVVDPGCARTLLEVYPRFDVPTPPVRLWLDLVHAHRDRLPEGALGELGPVRYHDPCQLGRGLGRYDEPRSILERITGQAPREFVRRGARAECSGGGGLLPVTLPGASIAMADERIAAHRDTGGGVLVTACAQSLHRFRSRGEEARDLVSLVDEALGSSRARG